MCVEKLEQLIARDESSMLQIWGKGEEAPRVAPLSREACAHLQTWLAQRMTQGAIQSPVLLTAFAWLWPTAWPLTAGAA